jgi:hypothetical protein
MSLLINRAKSFVKLYLWSIANYSLICQIRKLWKSKNYSNINTIVFSKDRAIQLHALLSSFFNTKIGECGIVVIYAASTVAHKKAYDEVITIFQKRVNFVEQGAFSSFKNCLLNTVSNLPNGKIFFLVDDIVFTEMVDYRFLAYLDLSDTIFSLRMGDHLNYSYVVTSKQPLPEALEIHDGCLIWEWSKGSFDWGYPMSLDGHLFITSEVLLWIKKLEFSSPSSFENSLQILKLVYNSKRGMSFRKSRLFNIPANKVQNEVDNLYGSEHQDDLLQRWNDGLAIDHLQFSGLNNYSVHQEMDFKFIKR